MNATVVMQMVGVNVALGVIVGDPVGVLVQVGDRVGVKDPEVLAKVAVWVMKYSIVKVVTTLPVGVGVKVLDGVGVKVEVADGDRVPVGVLVGVAEGGEKQLALKRQRVLSVEALFCIYPPTKT